MTLTPQDIQSKQFTTAFRGVDADEVDAFLEKVAEEMLILNLEAKQAEEKIEALKKEVEEYKKQEKAFKKAILSAQRISDEIEEKTKKEAEETLERAKREAEETIERARGQSEAMVAKARDEADRTRAEAEETIGRLKEEIQALSRMREEAVGELRDTLNRYLAVIDSNDFTGRARPAEEPAAADAGPPPAAAEPTEKPGKDESADRDEAPQEAAENAASPQDGPGDRSLDEDLSDLYEKIDLLDLEDDGEKPGDAAPAAAQAPLEEDDDTDLAIPELDGELLFNLDDPLDDLEPSIAINPDKRSE